MTAKASQFIAANGRSPIVYGSIIGFAPPKPATGVHYRLQDGTIFRLFRRDLDALKGLHRPRWLLV